jgi:hydrogenase 3 maturation protease
LLTDKHKQILSSSDGLSIFITVGNVLRRDDGVGPYIYESLEGFYRKHNNVCFINAANRPEIIVEDVIAKKPDKIIIIDSANFEGKPGEVEFFGIENIPDTSLSTHNIPLSVVAAILASETGSKIHILGIQMINVGLGEGLSKEIKRSADEIIEFLKNN